MVISVPLRVLRLVDRAPSWALDAVFGRPDPWPDHVPDTRPASYPPGYRRRPQPRLA